MKKTAATVKATVSWYRHWIVAVVALIVAFFTFVPAKPHYLPDAVTGVWTSSHPSYADRNLELTTVTMAFGTSQNTVDVYFVSHVETSLQGNRTLYTVHCHRRGGPEETVRFYHIERNGGEITLKNQQHVTWVRTRM